MREVKRKNLRTGRKKTVLLPPVWTRHADFIHPFEFINFWRTVGALDLDVMLEAKAKDLALLPLRHDLVRFGSDVAPLFDLGSGELTDKAEKEPVEIDAEQLEAS